MSLQTRRDYAVSKGLAEHKRGRMSKEAWDAIKEAEAAGTKFADSDQPYPKPPGIRQPGPRKATRERQTKTLAPTRQAPKRVVQSEVQQAAEPLAKPRKGEYEAIMPDGRRKKLSDRTACQCGASLSYCYCTTPKVGLLIVDPGADDVDAFVEIARV